VFRADFDHRCESTERPERDVIGIEMPLTDGQLETIYGGAHHDEVLLCGCKRSCREGDAN
jgi:hypothetical protein